MGLGKAIVMGLIALSTATQLIMAGAYGAGYERKISGASAVAAELLGAVVSGLAFLALYLDW